MIATRRRLAVLLIVAACSLCGAWASPVPDIYIDNRRFSGSVVPVGADLFVDAEAFARALQRPLTDGTPATLDGHPLPSLRTLRGRRCVRLDEAVAAAGVRMRNNAAVGIIDIITFDPTARARAIEAAERERQRTAPPPAVRTGPASAPTREADYDAIYQLALQQLQANLGMRINVEPRRHFVALSELRAMVGSAHVYGYTRSLRSGSDLTLDVYVARGLPYDRTLHVMLHELAHCWQHNERMNTSTARLTEGFAEWAAAHTLNTLGYTEEVARINSNLLEDYAEGYRYFERRAARIGALKTVDEMRNLRATP